MTQVKGTLLYRKYRSNRNDKTKGLYYARAVHDRTLEFDDLVAHVASHNSTFSRGTINGVLLDTLDCLKELILDGKQVRLGDLGLFSIGITTTGTESAADWNPAKNLCGVKLRVRNTKEWSNDELHDRISFAEDSEYDIGDEDGTEE